MAETMRERFVKVVGDLLNEDERTVVVLAVISRSLFADAGIIGRHPDRIIDVGIREQTQIGVAGGLSLAGFKPIITGYAPFLVERTFEQVKLDFDHQDTSAVLASVGGSWDASGSGRTHQAPEDVALMQSLRTWDVHVPGHPNELETVLRGAHTSGRRSYVRMTNDSNSRPLASDPSAVTMLRQGRVGAPTVMAVGPVAGDVLQAVEDLDFTVLYTATPYPIDRDGLRASVTGSAFYLVEPYLRGTSVAQVADALSDWPTQFRAHGVVETDIRRYGEPAEHRRWHGLDAAGIRSFLLA